MTVEQLHRLLLDNLNTAVLLLDERLVVDYINPAAESILQISSSRLRGIEASELFAEEKLSREVLEEALETEHPFTRRHEALKLLGGELVQVDYTITPITMNAAHWLLLEMQPIDRFLRINKEEALLSAHDTSQILIRGLAHEIKNPLGGIRGAAQLLGDEIESGRFSEEAGELCEIITTETDRLRNLVDRLLGPNQLPKIERLSVHEVTEHVAALIEAEAQGRLKLRRDYDPSIPDISGDREKLIQAVLNIVKNAMQSLLDNNVLMPEILLSTRIQRNFTIGGHHHKVVCRLDVVDNGPGVTEEISEKIFFPMISGRSNGSGLGLTIAQNAISMHQGIIECESEPGNTRFSIYLPIRI